MTYVDIPQKVPPPLAPPRVRDGRKGREERSIVQFIDVAFTASAVPSVIETITERPADAPFAYIVTPNVDHVVRLQRSRSDLWPAYRSAWMTLCDSRILAMLARRVGCALPVVPGSDLTGEMFAHVVRPTDRIAILGGNEQLIADLASRYGLQNVVHYDPPMGFIKDPIEIAKAVRFLIEARARYSFLAVGSPQQEILAYRVARAGGATGIGFCVGASLDFLTGVQVRAPLAMQHMGLEWLYRLSSNPRRMWRRYLVEGPEIFQIERSWRRTHAEP
ncbi:WecB/TagA/CpsF family glycosyltransferase [Sphingobium sp. H39-3-25]|uniref:WecB/TagA/CpsF family glycosyltransferase n=1 Tax=Sphingobium arseniciresistens TaxID=3030834 RepID=UPI0023B9FFD9|nr:WecB/TagA/CpsF family glycosyltransferase [Sphingobium arseniciresistens]